MALKNPKDMPKGTAAENEAARGGGLMGRRRADMVEKRPPAPAQKAPPPSPPMNTAVTRSSAPKVTSAPARSAAGKDFDRSFAAARRAGKSEFTWNGKRYNTKVK